MVRKDLRRRIAQLEDNCRRWREAHQDLQRALAAEINEPGHTLAQTFYCAMHESHGGQCMVQCVSCKRPPDWATMCDGRLVSEAFPDTQVR